jgi:hypothetical protein
MEKQKGRAQLVEERLAQLRDEAAEGLEQARRGDLLDGREVRERILAKSKTSATGKLKGRPLSGRNPDSSEEPS